MDRSEHTTTSAKSRRFNFVIPALVALLVVLVFGTAQHGPPPTNAPTEATDSEHANSSGITSPSSFPNITIKNFGQMDEYFYRGAQPKPDDYKTLAALGIKTIIDLRDDPLGYEKPDAEAAGIKYVNIPMSDKKKPSAEQVLAFFEVADDSANRPFYVHCAGGRHRTGLIGAVYRFNKYAWDYDQVYKEMKNYDYYSRWGHGAIKEYVQEYYAALKSKVKDVVPESVKVQTSEPPSEPVTPPPPPKFKE